jgi:hypothetical protein
MVAPTMSDPTQSLPSTADVSTIHPRFADGFVVQYRPAQAPPRRVTYEPRSAHHGWWRIEAVWTGCTWRPTGREPIAVPILREP